MNSADGGPAVTRADTLSSAPELPLIAYQGCVPPEWIDSNGHVTSMAYPALFHPATSILFGAIGIDRAYMAQRHLSVFQREYHLSFERELLEGSDILIKSYLIAFDEKRMHHFHELWHIEGNFRAACVEYLSVHIDMAQRRSAPFPHDIIDRLRDLETRYRGIGMPNGVGRRIGLIDL